MPQSAPWGQSNETSDLGLRRAPRGRRGDVAGLGASPLEPGCRCIRDGMHYPRPPCSTPGRVPNQSLGPVACRSGARRPDNQSGRARAYWRWPHWRLWPIAGRSAQRSRSTTPPPCAQCRKAGTTSSSARSTPPARSAWTSSRAPCGSKPSRCDSSASMSGRSCCPRRSRAC